MATASATELRGSTVGTTPLVSTRSAGACVVCAHPAAPKLSPMPATATVRIVTLALDMSRVTDIEYSALQALVEGERRMAEQGAERLGLSPDTVKTYTRTLYRKLGANRRRDAVARALTAGLIPPR